MSEAVLQDAARYLENSSAELRAGEQLGPYRIESLLGAGGIQTALGARGAEYNAKLRAKAEKHGMYVEGSVALPKNDDDAKRFYLKYGFIPLRDDPFHLYLPMATVRAMFVQASASPPDAGKRESDRS